MTSGSSPTSTMAPRRVQRRRGRLREDFSSVGATSDICVIIKDDPPTLGLYVHLPFCRTHCSYCAFAISTDIGLQDEYTDALVREIAGRASGLRARASVAGPRSSGLGPRSSGLGPRASVESVYFGGGTPSRMSQTN